MNESVLHGLLAEFAEPHALVEAARAARREYREVDAYAPFAVEGLAEALAFHDNRVPLIGLLGGIAGGAGAFFLQWYSAVVDYPINSGGKPLNSWPAFIPPTFELTVLGAALAIFFALWVLNGLPRLHHPIFNAAEFDLASRNRYFLCLRATDPRFDYERTRAFLAGLAPLRVIEVPGMKRSLPCALLACALALAGCERSFRDMYDQPRYKPLAGSPLWSDGRASRPPVEGSVAYSGGTLAGTSSGRLGRLDPAPAVSPLAAIRPELRGNVPGGAQEGEVTLPPITAELLAHGRERFDIYCSPCHSIVGDGDGFVVRRGFPAPPSYHSERLRAASDAHFYAVMTYGYGAMYSYADRLVPEDRLAVIAYIRALQLSQRAPLDAVPLQERATLETQR